MKKAITLVICSVLFLGAMAQKERNSNAVKLNPLSLIFATGNVSYERAIADNQSLQLGIFYSGVGISGLKYSGLGITPEYRVYFGGHREALNGVYVAPFLRYQNFKITEKETSYKATLNTFGGGATIGWEKTWNSGFVLDLFIGPSYNSGTVKSEDEGHEFDVSGGIEGFGVRTGIALGFAF